MHYLSLSGCTHFTTKGLHSIMAGKGCRRLVHLDLSGCTQLTAEGMHFLGKGCPILNTLVLDDLPDISDSMILVSDNLLSLLSLMCHLFLSSSSLQKLVSHCHTLRHISFLGTSSLSDQAFKFLSMENRKLRSIKIESKQPSVSLPHPSVSFPHPSSHSKKGRC